MNCSKIDILDININENYLYPFLGLIGLLITYLGNKFIKPTLFISGTIISSTSSFKLTEFILNKLNNNNCNIIYLIMLLSSISGGFLFLKLYHYMNFIIGFSVGCSIGYLSYIIWLYHYCLGTYFIFDTMLWICLLIPGFISGFIVHKKEKELSMILTSLIGPILIIIPLQELFEKKNLLNDYSLLKDIGYIFIYFLFSSTGFYIQHNREKHKKQINYLTNNFQVEI